MATTALYLDIGSESEKPLEFRVVAAFEKQQHQCGNGRAQRHHEGDGGQALTVLEQEASEDGPEHRATTSDTDDKASPAGAHPRWKYMGQDCVHANNCGVGKKAGAGGYQRQLADAINRARFLALLPYTDNH